jgi:hypothetical protein
MRGSRLILGFLCFIFCSWKGEKTDSICWSEERRLIWNDFQDKADTAGIYKGKKAITSVYIETLYYNDAGLPNYRVSNVFEKDRSWTIDTTSSLLLMHEQLHFDISELYARKIRKGIRGLRKQGTKEIAKYNDLINFELAERRNRQKQYDKGTHHGAIDILQREWNLKIKRELDLLKQYATKTEDCKSSGT